MNRRHFAHSSADKPVENWHPLEAHLEGTARRAERFAKEFAPGWGHLAGLLHDVGKYQPEFQRHIGVDAHCEQNDGRVDHSSVGAWIVKEHDERFGWPLAMVIAGHHGGLKSFTAVRKRLEHKADKVENARQGGLPPKYEVPIIPRAPEWLQSKQALAMWTRFLFSALVDADFLDTEAFYEGRERECVLIPLKELLERLEEWLKDFENAPPTAVNGMRARVLEDCRKSAAKQPGAFRLTVPTGGGKTLASLAFALRHAVVHQLERVIIVIPYTSILEQTASAYRAALGSVEAVLEHHSNIDPDREDHRSRTACENWDAPVVVTTSVQFFESLYSNRTSRTRKLHRISKSVVVFDEVQSFPPALLTPIENALRQLRCYGSSIVFCTATQPALRLEATEIVSDVAREFAAVADRVNYLFPHSEECVEWKTLAVAVRRERQALVIVHRRDDAAELASLVGGECIHLSARMCAAHREQVLTEVRRRLRSDEECRVVSTQLVEAGVDLDFPVVYRAMAGADALAQAAGRCNREGRRPFGELRIFHAPSRPFRELGKAMDTALVMHREGTLNLKDPAVFSEYFRRLYSASDTDPGVIAAEKELDFPRSADLFQMIQDDGKPVVAPWGDAGKWVELVRQKGVDRERSRRLQRFIVNLYATEIQRLERWGQIERMAGLEMWVTTQFGPGICYSPRFGFVTRETPFDPTELFIGG